MVYDEENLEPKPRKHHKKNLDLKMQSDSDIKNCILMENNKKQATFKSYCVIYDKIKREMYAFSFEDLVKSIREKFKIDEKFSLRLEYWSIIYQDWILLESLPDANSKIKVSLDEINLKNESLKFSDKNHSSEAAANKKVDELSNKLNSTFKKFIDKDDKEEFLNYFESAVVSILKKNIDDLNSKLNSSDELIKTINEDLNKMKSTDKQLKSQLDLVDEKLNQLDAQKKDCLSLKKKKCRKNFCTIS